ncbi:MAG: hypothetical protein Q9227_001580 [Pyrenula ochraceoflavens]
MFLPPFDAAKRDAVLNKWLDYAEEIRNGTNDIIFVKANDEEGQEKLAAVGMLRKPFAETGPTRGSVEKFFVAGEYRGMGVSRVLMEKIEERAREVGRTLLMLDTEAGSPAEFVYPKLGFTRMGVIPRYGISMKGHLTDGVFFYKHLE